MDKGIAVGMDMAIGKMDGGRNGGKERYGGRERI